MKTLVIIKSKIFFQSFIQFTVPIFRQKFQRRKIGCQFDILLFWLKSEITFGYFKNPKKVILILRQFFFLIIIIRHFVV
jgi:hypothetical protein